MSGHKPPRRTDDDSEPDTEQGAGQVSETVAQEHSANSNQVRHEPIQASRHSPRRQEAEVQNERLARPDRRSHISEDED